MALHSEAFAEIRGLIFELEAEDRRRLADLLGAMQAPKPELGVGVIRVLEALVMLDVTDRAKLSKWFASYVNRWGQIPRAAGARLPGYAYSEKREKNS